MARTTVATVLYVRLVAFLATRAMAQIPNTVKNPGYGASACEQEL